MKKTGNTNAFPPREEVKTRVELAERLGCSPGYLAGMMANQRFRASVELSDGRYDVEAAGKAMLEWQRTRSRVRTVASRRSVDGDEASLGVMDALKAKRLKTQIAEGEVRLEMIRRENEAHRRKWEAETGQVFTREKVAALCRHLGDAFEEYEQIIYGLVPDKAVCDQIKGKVDALRARMQAWVNSGEWTK